MNIFILDDDMLESVKFYNDKHCVKMVVETAQLLSTAHHEVDLEHAPQGIYKSTHKNHPCSIWARETSENYNWLYKLFLELLSEYTYRYEKIHKCSEMIDILRSPPKNIKQGDQTSHPQCMPDKYKTQNTVDAYRAYYIGDKQHIANWKKRDVPDWWITNPLDQPTL